MTMDGLAYTNFSQAARDGELETMKTCSRKETNRRDVDGMTPVHWAAAYGNIETLRIVIGKGGNPDKPNNEGSTAVHLAAGAGQLHCLVFLTNFGGNVHAVNDNGETPMQEAASKGRFECVRHLETMVTHQVTQDRTKVEKMQQRSRHEAKKRIKEKTKLLQKLDKDYERKASKHRKALGIGVHHGVKDISPLQNGHNAIDETDNKKKKLTYSQLTGVPRSDGESNEYDSTSNIDDESSSAGSFKRIEEEFLASLVSDDIVFERGSSSNNEQGSESTEQTDAMSPPPSNLAKTVSLANSLRSLQNGFLQNGHFLKLNSSQNLQSLQGPMVTLKNGQIVNTKLNDSKSSKGFSSGQLLRPQNGTNSLIVVQNVGNVPPSKRKGEPVGHAEVHMAPLYTFLHSLQLDEFRQLFLKEKIDLRACLLCDENDLKEIGLPLGPRKKIVDAINRRNQAINSNDEMLDTAV